MNFRTSDTFIVSGTMTTPQQFLIYQSEDGSTRIDVMLEAETLWLNQKQFTELFGKAKGTISEHIKHIFEDGEQDENSVVRYFRTTAVDGKQYQVAHYNLTMMPYPRLRPTACHSDRASVRVS